MLHTTPGTVFALLRNSSGVRRADNGIRDLDTGRRRPTRSTDAKHRRIHGNTIRRKAREREMFSLARKRNETRSSTLFPSARRCRRSCDGDGDGHDDDDDDDEEKRPERRVAGRVAGWDRTRWLVARQPDFPSRSLARASALSPPPFAPLPGPVSLLARSLDLLSRSRSFALLFAPPTLLYPPAHTAGSPAPSFRPPPSPPRVHTYTDNGYDAPVPTPPHRSLTLRMPEDAAEDLLPPRDAAPRTLHGCCTREECLV